MSNLKFLIITAGSRGDVEPPLALALRLKAKGHHVIMVAEDYFETFIKSRNVEFVPLEIDIAKMLNSEKGKEIMANNGISQSYLKVIKDMYANSFISQYEIAKAYSPDVILYHPKSLIAPSIAQKLQVPSILFLPLPFSPTTEFSSVVFGGRNFGRIINRLSYNLIDFSTNSMLDIVNMFRRDYLGINVTTQVIKKDINIIYCYSESILQRPKDWGNNIFVSGYWFLPDEEDSDSNDIRKLTKEQFIELAKNPSELARIVANSLFYNKGIFSQEQIKMLDKLTIEGAKERTDAIVDTILSRLEVDSVGEEITGQFLPKTSKGYRLDDTLSEFLKQKPIYIGTGSMLSNKQDELESILLSVINKVDRKFILCGKFSNFNLKDKVYQTESVPHSKVFPHCSLIINHGGAGTVARSLLYGIPQITIPFFADQPFWGNLLVKSGLSPASIRAKKLTSVALINAIEKSLIDTKLYDNCQVVSKKLQTEDGIENAISHIQSILK